MNRPSSQQKRTPQQGQPGSKKTPKIHFLNSLANVSVPYSVLQGVKVWQVAANGSTKAVILRVSEDKFTITLEPVKSKRGGFFPSLFSGGAGECRTIDIGEMDRIQRGQSTIEFEKAKKAMRPPPVSANSVRITSMSSNGSNAAGGAGFEISPSNMSSGATVSSIQTTASSKQPFEPDHPSYLALDPSLSFSIIFRGAHTVDLMAVSNQERTEVCDALDRLLMAYQRGKGRVGTEVQLLRYVWLHTAVSSSDNNNNSNNNSSSNQSSASQALANCNTVGKILTEINVVVPNKSLPQTFDKFGQVIGLDRAQRRKGLTFEQTCTFLHKLKRDSWMVKPVTVLWNELFGEVMNNGKIRTTVSDKTFLERFLHNCQGEVHSTLLDVRKLFRRLHDMEIAHTTTTQITNDLTRINKDQFEAFLLMHENEAFDPQKERHDKADMDQPLAEYWINTSHNTYLIGDQYKSHSSVEMYSNALYRGCRCLELDIWDGPKSSDNSPVPVVWHGHTMTTKIRFVDIIQTIKVFLNFHPDTFPIILSFENHCSIPYQQVMAENLVRILGEALYIPTEVSLYGQLPSPSQLRGMVIIKGRRPDGTEADAYDTDDESDDDDAASSNGRTLLTPEDEERRENVVKHGVAPELARLTLFHGTKLKSFAESKKSPTWHMHSFSENKVRMCCKRNLSTDWIVYNQSHMSRTYPAGSRVDSSNYNPLLAWSNGCQMVALNFQTQDAFLRLNDGRFRENGSCGYVLKPPSLMLKGDFDTASKPVRLWIRILSGSCIPKPRGQRNGDCIDPYVRVSVFDVKNEKKETETSYPTSVVYSNGLFPIFQTEKLQFEVENYAVAMLQLTVHDKTKDEFIASASIPISCLRRGIRSVKLYDATNTRSGAFDFASLLVEIKMGKVAAEI